MDDTKVNALIGMLKAKKRLKILEAAELLKVPESELTITMYELIGEGRITAEIDGNDFVAIESKELDSFINALDLQFKSWSYKEKAQTNKVDTDSPPAAEGKVENPLPSPKYNIPPELAKLSSAPSISTSSYYGSGSGSSSRRRWFPF